MAREEGKTSRAIRGAGHGASGGHASRGGKASNRPTASPYARINRTQWDNHAETGAPMAGYVFQEYPKHVYPDPDNPKAFVQVNSEEEEATVMGGAPLVRDEDERKRMLALAEVNDVKVDGRWSLGKMRKTLEDAGVDADLNPFE